MRTVVAVVLVLGVLLGGCGGDRVATGLRVVVPNAPGSGFDVVARSTVAAMEDAGLARDVAVFNLPGAGGAVALGRVVSERGNPRLLLQMGLGVVGAAHTQRGAATVADTTPIARLVDEPEIVVVPAGSAYTTLDHVLADWRADPGAVAVGGGSIPGGPDHLAAHLLAEAAGVDPGRVEYRASDGGGDLLAALLARRTAFGVSSATELRDHLRAGEVRVLAVTSAERAPGIDAPTLREAGVDLAFVNWRGLVAPPGISEADRRDLVALVEAVHRSPQWREVLARSTATDSYLAGDAFAEFLAQEDARVRDVLGRLGLAAG